MQHLGFERQNCVDVFSGFDFSGRLLLPFCSVHYQGHRLLRSVSDPGEPDGPWAEPHPLDRGGAGRL